MTRSDRLRQARTRAGFASASEAARSLGTPVATYTHHENGTRDFKMAAGEKYARRFGVDFTWLMIGKGEGLAAERPELAQTMVDDVNKLPPSNASFPPKYQAFPDLNVPLLGQSSAGPNGRFVLNGQRVQSVFCPPMLEGVEGAYAVLVYGTSMVPRFEPGETVWLHPYSPVRRDDYVVAQITGEDDSGELGSYIKQFVSRASGVLKLRQLNPDEGEPEILEFPDSMVFSVHKIVFQALV